jgi:hypothetical protein
MMTTSENWIPHLDRLREFQGSYKIPISDITKQAPAQALHSLREAAERAPTNYQQYLEEAIDCYEATAYRGAVLMVWAATVEHLYSVIGYHRNGFKDLQAANIARFEKSGAYKKITKKNDLLYLNDKSFFLLCEDAGVLNKNARLLLDDALATRNRCGHPTGYAVGREEVVIFIERMINNFISGAMIDWD